MCNSSWLLYSTGSASPVCMPPSFNKHWSYFHPSTLHQSRWLKNQLIYDSFQFKKTTINIGSDGKSTVTAHTTLQTILVVQGWQAHKKGSVPWDGYIGKGLSKYAFQVCINLQIHVLGTHYIMHAGSFWLSGVCHLTMHPNLFIWVTQLWGPPWWPCSFAIGTVFCSIYV